MFGQEWLEIVQAIQTETDPEKISCLVRQLCRALDDEHQRTSGIPPNTGRSLEDSGED